MPTTRHLIASAALALGVLAAPAAAGAAGFTTPRPTPPPPIGPPVLRTPVPDLSITAFDAAEADGEVEGLLTLSAPLGRDLMVFVTPQHLGTTEADFDCPRFDDFHGCLPSMELEIPAGATELAFDLGITGDDGAEPAETVGFHLGVFPEHVVDKGPDAEAVIYDGDGLHLSLVDDDPEALEGDPGSDGTLDLVVEADQAVPHPVTFRAYSVIVGFGATPGADYTPIDLIAELPAGETTTTVSVPLVGDQLDESPYEIFMAHIADPSHGEIAFDGGTAVPRIMDDDGPDAAFETPDGYQSPSRSARSAALTA